MHSIPNYLYRNRGIDERLHHKNIWQTLHLDAPLLAGLLILIGVGFVILYSASNENTSIVERQGIRMLIAFGIMFVCAQIPPRHIRRWAPWFFLISCGLLGGVLFIGHIGKGAQRWLNLGFMRFQPSEIMKLTLPLMLAWFLASKELPPNKWVLIATSIIILVPAGLTAKQPDLGTALLIMAAGMCVLLLAGMPWRVIVVLGTIGIALLPVAWHFLHGYQQQRILTFLNPERDPLGHGYHIIQSKIAIGSGGLFGKGWLNGTQSHLDFLPEHSTDFIFAVGGEEFGLFGGVIILLCYLFITVRSLYISTQARNNFGRLLAGTLALTFFLSAFINIGMVVGILPVVGLPLPLISYGGTSMVITLAGFGIIMSVHTHKRLLAT